MVLNSFQFISLVPAPAPAQFLLFYYLWGALVVSVLGCLLLRNSRGKSKSKSKSRAASMEMRGKGRILKSSQNASTDIIIVGAGVAGSALAYTLGKDGWLVHVIERDLTEPDRIVGELLQPGGYLKLMELDLEDCLEEIDAQPVYGYVIYNGAKVTKWPYPLKKFRSDAVGRCFHNGCFVQKLRNKAAAQPNVRLEQGTVTSLIEEEGTVKGVEYKTKTGEKIAARAPLTIVCDGCFSNFRRSLCNPKVEILSYSVGLVLEDCELPYKNHGHLLFPDPQGLLFYPIGSNEIRCLVDVPSQRLPSIANGEMTHHLKTVVARQIPTELHSAFMRAIEKGNIRTMPNRSMPAAPSPTPGAFLLGDSLNMRHPLTAGGMTVALSDVVVLRDLLRPLCDLNDAPALCKCLKSFYTLRKPVASTINIFADVLHTIFRTSNDTLRSELQEASFDYVSLGGVFSDGLIALVSGLYPSPWRLVIHLTGVAVLGLGRQLLPFPSPKRLLIGARYIRGAASMIIPIVKAQGVRETFFPATMSTRRYTDTPPPLRLICVGSYFFIVTILIWLSWI